MTQPRGARGRFARKIEPPEERGKVTLEVIGRSRHSAMPACPIWYPVIPFDGLLGVADIIKAYMGQPASIAKVHLYTNDYVPSNQTVLSSFVEATAGGFGAQPLPVPTNDGIDADWKDVLDFGNVSWTSTGTGLPIVIYGWWVDFKDPITAATRVFWTQRLEVPWASWQADQTLIFQLTLGINQCG